jgi:hypothetical protein
MPEGKLKLQFAAVVADLCPEASGPSPWQCATTHCYCNSCHHPETVIWDHKSSSLQFRPRSIRLSCVWHTEESIARTKISQRCQGEGDGPFLASMSKKNCFFYWNTETCQKMWKVHCKGWWICGKIRSYLDLHIRCASQYNAIWTYLLKSPHISVLKKN